LVVWTSLQFDRLQNPHPIETPATVAVVFDLEDSAVPVCETKKIPGHVLVDPDEAVLTFSEWCQVNRISPATGRRIIASGAGPVITRLSERRIGITVGNNRKWREARSASME
jgi:hypothetical protein